MNICFCCECCCVEAGIKELPRYLRGWHQKMEGLSVTVNPDLCTGCGLCLDACIFGAIEIIDNVAVIDREGRDFCTGCGRCEKVCPTGAITLSIEGDGVERMIARIESHVDVT
ncbi:MAG: DUF362 domain-containing protein [Promethearchaeota archaeon]